MRKLLVVIITLVSLTAFAGEKGGNTDPSMVTIIDAMLEDGIYQRLPLSSEETEQLCRMVDQGSPIYQTLCDGREAGCAKIKSVHCMTVN